MQKVEAGQVWRRRNSDEEFQVLKVIDGAGCDVRYLKQRPFGVQETTYGLNLGAIADLVSAGVPQSQAVTPTDWTPYLTSPALPDRDFRVGDVLRFTGKSYESVAVVSVAVVKEVLGLRGFRVERLATTYPNLKIGSTVVWSVTYDTLDLVWRPGQQPAAPFAEGWARYLPAAPLPDTGPKQFRPGQVWAFRMPSDLVGQVYRITGSADPAGYFPYEVLFGAGDSSVLASDSMRAHHSQLVCMPVTGGLSIDEPAPSKLEIVKLRQPAQQHDFSNPYLLASIPNLHGKRNRLCVVCGEDGGRLQGCTPQPGWRERFEAGLAFSPTVPPKPRVLPYSARDLLGPAVQDVRLMGLAIKRRP